MNGLASCRICNSKNHYSERTDAIELQQSRNFDNLDQKLQLFISQYASGHTKLVELFKNNELCIAEHMSKTTMQSEMAVKAHISKGISTSELSVKDHVTNKVDAAAERITLLTKEVNGQAINEKQRERLLQSIKFPGMNERRSHLSDSHEGTFEWIFNQPLTSDAANDSFSDDASVGGSDARNWPSTAICDNFVDWLKSDSDMYWISGKPGSGKSTLVKFITDNPATTKALESWATDNLVVSHFLWKPGSRMQRNIRGMLCNILHQLLRQSIPTMDNILAKFKSPTSKDSNTDWSVKELHAMVFAVLTSYPYHLCIFLDGLDEICVEDGVNGLMRFVNELRVVPHVKVCVASRPDLPLHTRLSMHQQLRLQDLTRCDMTITVAGMLQAVWDDAKTPEIEREDIVWRIVSKAEGVFLWIHVTLRSLIDGFESGDSHEDLISRVEELPSELLDLYWKMWLRLNENTKAYREAAARYFNMLIYLRDASEAYEEESPLARGYSGESMSVFEITAATTPAIQDAFLRTGSLPSGSKLRGHCFEVEKALSVRCAGLVEIQSEASGWESQDEKLSSPEEYRQILPYLKSRIRVIHRTVYDFLADTEEGRKIRSYDLCSRNRWWLNLLIGRLIRVQVSCNKDGLDRVLHFTAPLSRIRGPTLDADTCDLLWACWRSYDEGLLANEWVDITPSPHFLNVIQAVPAFNDFVLAAIKASPDPPGFATDVLRDMWKVNQWFRQCIFNRPEEDECMLSSLLSLKADPDQSGAGWTMGHILTGGKVISYLSPLASFLEEAMLCNVLGVAHVRKCVQLFQGFNPRYDSRLSLAVMVHEMNGGEYQVQTRSTTFVDGFELSRSKWKIAGGERRVFIIEGNLTFWTQVLLGRLGDKDSSGRTPATFGGTQPIARVMFVMCGRKRFRVLHEGVSSEMMSVLEPWLIEQHEESRQREVRELGIKVAHEIWETVANLNEGPDFADMNAAERRLEQESTDKSRCYEEYHDYIIKYLANRDSGYACVDNAPSTHCYSNEKLDDYSSRSTERRHRLIQMKNERSFRVSFA